MKTKLDVVREVIASGPVDLERANEYYTDDFKWIDGDGNVTDRQTYLGIGQMMVAAFPDLEFVRTGLREEGNQVVMTGHFKGTFTNDIDLSAMGLGVIPASGEMIEWPDSSSNVKVNGEMIAGLQDLKSGGLAVFLAPLGVKMPAE